MAIPIISDLLERLFGPAEDPHSRDDVKRRLQIVLAHDRLALDPQTLEMMRQEIIAVVSRYVEVDFESLEFSLATNERVTALTANLPIRRIRPLGRGADKPIDAEQEAERIELASPSEALALDARETEAALKRFEEDNRDAHPYLDIDRTGLDSALDEEAQEVSSDEPIGKLTENGSEENSGEMNALEEVGLAEPSLSSATSLPFGLPSGEADVSDSNISDSNISKSNVSDLSESSILEVPDMSIPDASVQPGSKQSPNKGRMGEPN